VTVTDDEGATDTDTATISIDAEPSVSLSERNDDSDVDIRDTIDHTTDEQILYVLRDSEGNRLDLRNITITGTGVAQDVEVLTDEGFFIVDYGDDVELNPGGTVVFELESETGESSTIARMNTTRKITRQIASEASPGDSINVTVSADLQASTDAPVIVEKFSPAFASSQLQNVLVDDQPAALLNSTTKPGRVDVILAEAVRAGETLTLTYTVDIPTDAQPGSEYVFGGNITTDQAKTEIVEDDLPITESESGLSEYRNEDGSVTTLGLRDAIEDWRNGDIQTALLGEVITAWRSS
jgi:hypothetical protein